MSAANQSLQLYTDDRFKLQTVPTLEWLESKIPIACALHVQGGQMLIVGALLSGVMQEQARGFLPKAPRGVHGHSRGDAGVMAWKKRCFPDIPARTLAFHAQYARDVLAAAKRRKTATVAILAPDSWDAFIYPSTQEEWQALYAALFEVTEGKTITAFLREMRAIREALPAAPPDNTGKKRLSKLERELMEKRARAATLQKQVSSCVRELLAKELFLHIGDEHLPELRDQVGALERQLIKLCRERKLR